MALESTHPRPTENRPVRIHIGGSEMRDGWSILNIQPGPGVDFVGTCIDLSQFPDGSVDELYGSHVYEHLGYQVELPKAFSEAHRVLKPGGTFRVGVPDLTVLCRLLLDPSLRIENRYHVMRVIYGGQMDAYDFHKVGFTTEILWQFLQQAGFAKAHRVADFGLFKDCTLNTLGGHPISLNMEATK